MYLYIHEYIANKWKGFSPEHPKEWFNVDSYTTGLRSVLSCSTLGIVARFGGGGNKSKAVLKPYMSYPWLWDSSNPKHYQEVPHPGLRKAWLTKAVHST